MEDHEGKPGGLGVEKRGRLFWAHTRPKSVPCQGSGTESGIGIVAWHFGHRADLPALVAGTRYRAAHWGHWMAIRGWLAEAPEGEGAGDAP